MKRMIFALLSLALSSVFLVNGTNYQELFLRANKLYKEGAYEKALPLYQSIPNKSAAVLYNSGNCFYQRGNYIDALVAFKRAHTSASRVQQKSIEQNIEHTLQALEITHAPLTYTQRVYAYLSNLARMIPLLFLQLLFLLLLYSTFLCVRYMRTKERRVVLIILSIFTIVSGIALGIKYDAAWYAHGIVTCKQVPIFVGPDKKYDASGTVTLTDELVILEKRADWYKVKKGNVLGWIPAECIAEID